MEEQFKNALELLKKQDVDGCITGSIFLEINPEWNQDIDLFLYSEKAFTKLFYALYHNPMFTIIDKVEDWKADMFMNDDSFNSKHISGVQTIKFIYNTCVPINIIYKKNCNNIFSVLSSFDLDIIAKGYDLKTGQYLDFRQEKDKTVTWNIWNPAFRSGKIWQISRILRQLERCFKYHKRGYNTDLVVLKYIELIDKIQESQNIFKSETYNEKLEITKTNTLMVKKLCELWLETHEISDEQLEKLQLKLKEI